MRDSRISYSVISAKFLVCVTEVPDTKLCWDTHYSVEFLGFLQSVQENVELLQHLSIDYRLFFTSNF
jgi:hypothetical protein